MPVYPGNGLANILRNNTQGILFAGEAATATELSISFLLERINRSFYPWGFAVEIQFSGAPGAFEFDIMGAETDASTNYVKIGSITAVNSSNVGRFESVALFPKYVAGYIASIGNSVNITAKVSH